MTFAELMSNVRIVLADLPCTVPALVSVDESDYYTIILNARMTRERQKKELKHELRHIARDDFRNASPIRAVERSASA